MHVPPSKAKTICLMSMVYKKDVFLTIQARILSSSLLLQMDELECLIECPLSNPCLKPPGRIEAGLVLFWVLLTDI